MVTTRILSQFMNMRKNTKLAVKNSLRCTCIDNKIGKAERSVKRR